MGQFDALVTDVHIRWAVAGLRALGRHGLRTFAVGPGHSAAGVWSRYAAGRGVAPDSVSDPRGFAAEVGRLAAEKGPLVVYPGHEEAIDALFDADLPPEAILPYPGAAVTQGLRDKPALAAYAEAAGLAAPRTVAEATAGELRGQALPLPCAVKPARPGTALGTTRVIDDPQELRDLLDELPDDERLLIQERAEGPLVGLALVVSREGEQVARFQQEARRTWPPNAGGSTLAVSVAPDEQLAERATRVLADAGYWGLAQMQFLTTPRGPALIDVNTRFYGSLPLALAAGANLPAAWHAVTTDGAAGPPPPYRVGVSYRWLEAELVAAFRGQRHLLHERAPRPSSGAMWAGDDPLPSAILSAQSAGRRIGRRLLGRGEG